MRIREAAARARAAIRTDTDRQCCVYARALLRLAYGADVIDEVPTWRWHLIAERGAGPWEPVHAAIDAGIGTGVGLSELGRARAGRPWLLGQGWRGPVEDEDHDGRPYWPPRYSGHTFLLRVVAGDTVEIIDSTERTGGDLRWGSLNELGQEFRGGIAFARLHLPGSAEVLGQCGRGGCTRKKGHEGSHWRPDRLDPWDG